MKNLLLFSFFIIAQAQITAIPTEITSIVETTTTTTTTTTAVVVETSTSTTNTRSDTTIITSTSIASISTFSISSESSSTPTASSKPPSGSSSQDSGSHVLWILLGSIGGAVLLAVLGIFIFRRLVSRPSSDHFKTRLQPPSALMTPQPPFDNYDQRRWIELNETSHQVPMYADYSNDSYKSQNPYF